MVAAVHRYRSPPFPLHAIAWAYRFANTTLPAGWFVSDAMIIGENLLVAGGVSTVVQVGPNQMASRVAPVLINITGEDAEYWVAGETEFYSSMTGSRIILTDSEPRIAGESQGMFLADF